MLFRSGRNKTKLYMIWKGMHSRCRDRGNTSYSYYGALGIAVDPVWATYEPFRDWSNENGYSEGLSLDRVNPMLNYSSANCRWVTRSENSAGPKRKDFQTAA